MPELPEVESLRKFVDSRVAGRTITRVELAAVSALKTFDPPIEALKGRRVISGQRRGKYLGLVTASDDESEALLVCHLSLGGWMRWYEELSDKKPKLGAKGPLALRVGFDDGSGFDYTEAGTEKRLALWVVREMTDVAQVQGLGPDPLQIKPSEIASIIRSHKGQIKKVLTDQQILAGIGNAYSDEALHVAKLSPFRQADKLTPEEADALAAAVLEVLTDAVERSVDVPVAGLKKEKKSGLRVHGKTGQPCPVCGDTIREVSFSSRSLQYCATCQTGGKPLADRRLSRLLK
jgi:formamidopyrimidine-DNA glycosylase